jgi:uncharacterized membrane protein
MSYSAPSLRTSTFIVAPGMGYGYGGGMGIGFGSSLVNILVLVVFVFFAFSIIQGLMGGAQAGDGGGGGGVALGGDRVNVVRLQVGLLGIARSLQADLDAIADKADTSTPDGLQYVLQETVLTLLRHPDYCVYGAPLCRYAHAGAVCAHAQPTENRKSVILTHACTALPTHRQLWQPHRGWR